MPEDERWDRYYEGYSENLELVSELGVAAIEGYQKQTWQKAFYCSLCKHFIGDGATIWGTGDNNYMIDRGNSIINKKDLYEKYLPPYEAAIESGVLTVMASFNSYNGLKCHASKYLFTDLLKDELGFDGFVISDWRGIDEIPGDYKSDIITSINLGIDMVMVPGDTIWGGESYYKFLKLFKESILEVQLKKKE